MDQKVSKERLAVHEASHAVVAKLFEDQLYLRSLTIAEQSIVDRNSGGVPRLGMIGVEPKGDTWVAPSIVSLAGMVGETIATQLPAKVMQLKEMIILEPHKHIDTLLGGGDFDIFYKDASQNARHYGTEKDYEMLCLRFLIDFLCNDSVWPIVQQLKGAVLKKENLTLNEQELDALFETTSYTTYIKEQKEQLLEPFQKRVDTDSMSWQFKQMIMEKDVNLFNDSDDKKTSIS